MTTTMTTTIDAIAPCFECNPHVLRGYRPIGMSWGWYASSVLAWHNETVNAATMLVGFVVFLDALERAVRRWRETSSDAFPLVVFRACTMMMFACSTAYHAFWPRGRRAYETLLRLDHACIVLCVGSYAFPTAAIVLGSTSSISTRAYWFVATLVTARNVLFVLRKKPNTAKRLRATAATAWFVPALFAHGWFLASSTDSASFETYRRAIVVGVMFPLGALAYATKVPDRFFPGYFDHVGSHEFMHACVLVAAMVHGNMFERSLL